MRRMLLGTVTAIACLAFAHTASAQDAKIDKGKKVYAEQKCSMCHAIEGKGNAKGPLDNVGSTLSEEEIHSWIVEPAKMTAKTKAERKPPMIPRICLAIHRRCPRSTPRSPRRTSTRSSPIWLHSRRSSPPPRGGMPVGEVPFVLFVWVPALTRAARAQRSLPPAPAARVVARLEAVSCPTIVRVEPSSTRCR